MITDLESCLQLGKPWPPESEIDRLERYKQNEQLFDGEHTKVFQVLLKLFASATAEYNKLIVILNWHRRLSTLWADFLFSEQPRAIASQDPESKEQKYLDDFVKRNRYWALMHTRQIDVSRFGHGIVEGYFDGEECRLQSVHPSKFFPSYNVTTGRITEYCIAWTGPEEVKDHIKQRTLYIRIHRAGEIESREYSISSLNKLIAGPFNAQIQETGVDQPLISVIENLKTSSDKLVDDYGDLDTIIKRIESRLTRVGRILDVHSEPILALSEDSAALTKTTTGEYVYDSKKKIITLPPKTDYPQYITWEGQLTAAFQEIERELQQMYTITETCEACFEPTKLGAQVSGTALRLMLWIPLKKVDRLKLAADPTITDELLLFTEFENIKGNSKSVLLDWISIHWEDGLPEDFRETVAAMTQLKAVGLIWDEMALKMLYKLEGTALQDALTKLKAQNVGGVI